MCGIVGYLGKGQAYPALIKGLKRLEYRGYDSAGVALISEDGSLNVYKAKGKVADLEAYCADKDVSGSVGIAHTRWATHGEPSSVNATLTILPQRILPSSTTALLRIMPPSRKT